MSSPHGCGMRYSAFATSILASLLAVASVPTSTSKSHGSTSLPSEAAVTSRSGVQRRNAQTGLGLKKSLSSDSKIAKNVLESKGEGYCSVSCCPGSMKLLLRMRSL